MKKARKRISLFLAAVLVFSLNIPALAAENHTDFVVADGVLTRYTGSASDVVIPDNLGIAVIGDEAFAKCAVVTSVSIPEGVTAIGDYAFSDCSKLVSISLPKSVGSIGKRAFLACWSLDSIKIPDGVTAINEGTFSNCSSLTSVTIPGTVTALCGQAFDGCYSLKTVVLPETVTEIGDSAFANCSGLVSFDFPAGVTVISPRVLSCCGSLASVSIPDGVTSIGDAAFYGCDSLKSILIPDSVTEIGSGAFSAVGRNFVTATGLTLEGTEGSCAEQFAGENGIAFRRIIVAEPLRYTLSVDGKEISLWAYEIDGGTYFKLRDLAMALNGTKKQFEVEWNGEINDVWLYPDTPYTPVGGELSKPAGKGPAAASISSTFFWKNSLCTYVIDGWHYIKLSDLAASLYFSASCDDETYTAIIDTSSDTIIIPKSTGQAEPIDNITLMDAGYSWTVNGEGNVVLSYDAGDGESSVVTPATVEKDEIGEYFYIDTYPGVYMSDGKTAIAYGGYNGGPLYVICSDDMGKTWSDPVMIQNSVGVSSLYISFATKDDGWLVIGNFHGMGSEDNFVYRTIDGGKTWTQLGNPNELYSRMLTGAGFANDEIGFLGFRFEFSDFSPAICRTLDGGQTWEKLYVELPREFDEYYSKTPLSPVFNGADGILPVDLVNNDGDTLTIYFTTDDYGMTWTYDETYNLARTWAEARMTWDGETRYDIMSTDMQGEFLERQEAVSGDSGSFTLHGAKVDYYDIEMDGDDALITYWYNDGYGNSYKAVERLAFGEETDQAVVIGCETETAFTELELYNRELPVLTLQDDQIIYEKKTGGITQGFYESKDGNKFYSYFSIGGVKYDLGYVGYGGEGGYSDILCTLTDIDSDTPVYQQTMVYGATASATSYFTVRDNIPYLLYTMPGTGMQYDLDGDGSVETVSNSGTTLFPEDFIYEWHVQAGTIDLLPLTEALGCDEASYKPGDNLIHTYNFIYDNEGGESGPPKEGPLYRYAEGKLIDAGAVAKS